MEIKSLRVGNLINGLYYEDNDEKTCICEVLAIDSTDNSEYPIWVESVANVEVFSNFEPIPLTEEVLLRCGFKSVNNGFLCKKRKIYLQSDNCIFEYWGLFFDCEDSVKIEFLYQLQNLYFALTGEELTYNHSPSI